MLKIKKIIVRLRMWYADIRGHHGRDGTMNLVIGTWADIEKENDRLLNYNFLGPCCVYIFTCDVFDWLGNEFI